MGEPQVGGWVKLVQGTTVINGDVIAVDETHIQIFGLPPIPRSEWALIINKTPSPTPKG